MLCPLQNFETIVEPIVSELEKYINIAEAVWKEKFSSICLQREVHLAFEYAKTLKSKADEVLVALDRSETRKFK